MKTAASKPLLTFASNATTVIFQSMIINDNALSFQNSHQILNCMVICFNSLRPLCLWQCLFSNISYDHICNSFHASKCYCLGVSALVANFSISSKFDHHLMPLALITNCHIARDCPILASRVFKNVFFGSLDEVAKGSERQRSGLMSDLVEFTETRENGLRVGWATRLSFQPMPNLCKPW